MAGAVDELVSDFGDLLSIEEIAVVLANRLGAVIRVEEQVKLTELLDICQDILNTYAMRP
jgi:4-hydroxy-3-methylbut-2-en-1-yl diphosphate synthase IspG/GcpE